MPISRLMTDTTRLLSTGIAVVAVVFMTRSARATDKADCTAAQKAAQADKLARKPTRALTELATCSRPVCPKAMQKQCADLTDALKASLPTVVFAAKDASGNAVTQVTVTVDGAVVASALDGTPVPLDPGSHAMKFEMDGATTVEKQVTVAEGEKAQPINIDLDANPPAATPITPVVAAGASGGPGSMFDTDEDPTKRYYFIGLRYRGDIVPKFMTNLFVDGGKTLYSNSIGLEADLRHDHFSLIPAITYTEYGTGDMLFLQKNTDATNASNWSVVNSGLKGIYLSADLLWSVRIANHWDFEYGAEFGLGFIFGTLGNNWVFPPNPGTVSPTNYQACTSAGQAASCNYMTHNGATSPGHINGYDEPSWANGGSKPNVFPLVNFPQIGVRYKPIKQMEARFGVGFSLTGFWFGLSANYGLEKPTK